jgi:hypothetical protein
MSNFDNLPSARPRKPAPARDAPTAPKPSRPAFEFNSPEDTPKGVKYRKTAEGFVASAPTFTWMMSILMGLSTLGIGYILWRSAYLDGTPSSFWIFWAVVMSVLLIFFLYFAFGRVRVSTNARKLVISKTIFGIGFPRRFDLLKIERMRIKNRVGVRGLGWGAAGMAEVKDQVCEIETDKEIRIFGAHLESKHLYYMRYLVIRRIKELKGDDSQVKH